MIERTRHCKHRSLVRSLEVKGGSSVPPGENTGLLCRKQLGVFFREGDPKK